VRKILLILILNLVLTLVQAKEKDGNTPCLNLVKACKEAGFSKAKDSPKRQVYRDCVDKMLKGETVEGVTVDPADVTACLQKKRP
jgi:hypothetical protein